MPAARPRIVTLTTDFGTLDSYVGQMKGAILTVCPDVLLVDITHDVPPHDIAAGGFAIATAFTAFPPGTIHLVVVDPGVGSDRRGVVVRTASADFVAPDNGVLTRALDRDPERGAWVLEASHYRRSEVAPTFHGRDVFAPAAAWLARGIEPSHFGPPADSLVRLPGNRPSLEAGRPSVVRVAHVDRFGNVILDLARHDLAAWCDPVTGLFRGSARAGAIAIVEVRRTYADGPSGVPFLLFDALDRLEIAVRDASAAGHLGLRPGDEVAVVPAVL